jgi:hypothetical protein
VLSIGYLLGMARRVAGYHRQTTSHRLEDRVRHALGGGKMSCSIRSVQDVRYVSAETSKGSWGSQCRRQLLQFVGFGTVSDNQSVYAETRVGGCHTAYQQVKVFAGFSLSVVAYNENILWDAQITT